MSIETVRANAAGRAEEIADLLGDIADYELEIDQLTARVVPLIREANESGDWRTLGHSTHGEYVSERFGPILSRLRRDTDTRRELVGSLRAEGMTIQDIADSIGSSRSAVGRDIQANSQMGNEVAPATIQTARGERPATYTTQTPAPADDREADAGAGLPSPASLTVPQGEAGPYSSGADAVGATAPEGFTPAGEPEAGPATTAPRPQVSPSPEVAEYLAGGSTDDLRFVQAFLRDSRTSLASYREHEDRIVDLVRRGVGVFGMGALDTTLQTARSALEFLERIDERANTTTLRRIK